MSDSEEFQDIESNYSGIFSRSQASIRLSFQVFDLCRAATNACHLTHGIYLKHRETFLAIHALCSIHRRHFVKEILHSTTPSATGAVPVQGSTVTPLARGEERIGSTTTMPMSERRPSTTNSFLPVEIPQTSVVVQLQISELQFDKVPTPSSFMYWKIRFKPQVSSCSDFPSEAMLWIKEVEMAISCWKECSKFRNAGRQDRFCSEEDHPEFPFQEEGQSRGTDSPKRGSVSSRKTDRLHDLQLLSSDCADLFSVALRNDNVQECDARWG